MEIVAKKYQRVSTFILITVLCAFLIFMGVGLLIASGYVVNFPDALDIMAFVLLVLGVLLTAAMIFAFVIYKRLPENLITYENGVFTFPKGVTCRAEEITDVRYDSADASYKSVSYNFGFGQIKLRIGDKKLKVKYVGDPAAVSARIKTLVKEAKLSAPSQTKYEAEAMARVASQGATEEKSEPAAPAQKPDDSDPFDL